MSWFLSGDTVYYTLFWSRNEVRRNIENVMRGIDFLRRNNKLIFYLSTYALRAIVVGRVCRGGCNVNVRRLPRKCVRNIAHLLTPLLADIFFFIEQKVFFFREFNTQYSKVISCLRVYIKMCIYKI